ncbi:hypothetical protein TWF569_004920 [Orbilia oligospora]|uniref:Myb-like DNA-binding domain-containing protein n=1 Tax=Orbilia oligospora TaxID=2813651 RepID=A0A7C8N200_ORBOL|nr:hypothetical protein TWF102_008437 [Orbilia oligospora]KAF3109562.1 hypothetical protein TWF706_001426 [Orbilia oligospora]KAF3114709.1 hypothetical protein TWF103_000446 [Orbilia oligospora]KAF3119196.1 hypothetical protein TWF703_003586 [Orbilia oligospora]KAF3149742.1 hypothetical protein TWF569_004920 [Orbilia oligospora]
MVSNSNSVSDQEFLLRCIEHVHGDLKINFDKVAKDLGYASAAVAANRMRSLRKKLQEKRDEKGAKADDTSSRVKKVKETDENPKAKRGKKRKIEEITSKYENEEDKNAEDRE